MGDNIYSHKAWIDKFIHREPVDISDGERVRKIIDAMPEDVKTVLDVGLGGGYIYRELKKKIGIRCFGVDLSADLVARLKMAGTCVADAAGLPFGERRFDLVLAADLLEHIKEDHFEQTVKELQRVSRRYVLINSPYKDAIDWPVALCDKCNKEFNVYGHIRSVDMALIRRCFPEARYEITLMEAFGRKRDPRPAAIVRPARLFGKLYSREGALCPYCFNDTIRPPARNGFEVFIGKMFAAALYIMDALTPPLLKQGSEIRVLLRKKDELR